MKILRLTTDNNLTIHDFPEGSCAVQNKELRKLIGDDCRIYEHVMPRKLYSLLGHKNSPTEIKGECISMLVDEEGLVKNEPLPINYVATFLYDAPTPIVGNVLFVGEEWCNDGLDFCGIDEAVFNRLYAQLSRATGLLLKE